MILLLHSPLTHLCDMLHFTLFSQNSRQFISPEYCQKLQLKWQQPLVVLGVNISVNYLKQGQLSHPFSQTSCHTFGPWWENRTHSYKTSLLMPHQCKAQAMNSFTTDSKTQMVRLRCDVTGYLLLFGGYEGVCSAFTGNPARSVYM